MTKKNKKELGDNMQAVAKKNYDYTNPIAQRAAFMEWQDKRIKELESMVRRMETGKKVSEKKIAAVVDSLKQAGILDENGEIAAPYRIENE